MCDMSRTLSIAAGQSAMFLMLSVIGVNEHQHVYLVYVLGRLTPDVLLTLNECCSALIRLESTATSSSRSPARAYRALAPGTRPTPMRCDRRFGGWRCVADSWGLGAMKAPFSPSRPLSQPSSVPHTPASRRLKSRPPSAAAAFSRGAKNCPSAVPVRIRVNKAAKLAPIAAPPARSWQWRARPSALAQCAQQVDAPGGTDEATPPQPLPSLPSRAASPISFVT
eukprot:365268-Chlamydomonas_euryale.AAC.13